MCFRLFEDLILFTENFLFYWLKEFDKMKHVNLFQILYMNNVMLKNLESSIGL